MGMLLSVNRMDLIWLAAFFPIQSSKLNARKAGSFLRARSANCPYYIA